MTAIFSALLYLLTGLIPTLLVYWLVGLIIFAAIRRIRGQPMAGVAAFAFRWTWPAAALWTLFDFYRHILR